MGHKIITVTLNPCIDKTITINGFIEGGLNRAEEVRTDAGGKGINVAKVLKNLGCEVLATGVMGHQGSDNILAELAERQIEHRFLKVPGTTRTNYKLYNKETKKITEVNEPGFEIKARDKEAVFTLLNKELDEGDILVLSGSAAPGCSTEIYKELILQSKKKRVRVVLDADGERLQKGLEAAPFAAKPNLYELELFLGRKISDISDVVACGQTILDQGIELLVVSLGAEGAVFMTKQERYYVKPPVVQCRSTVGAGDSMVAAIAYGLAENMSIKAMAGLATAAGTVTATKEGTQVCDFYEVQAFLEKLLVESL